MARRTKRSTHPYQAVPARRGAAGYVGVAADAADDPAIVWPDRPVKLPPTATTPIYAGPDDVTNAFAGGGGGLLVDNTVDPPAEVTTLIAPGAAIAGDEATIAAVFIRQVEVVVAFDDDLVAGVEVVPLVPGQSVLALGYFVETALTHSTGRVSIMVGAVEIGECDFGFLIDDTDPEIGSNAISSSGVVVRAAASPVSIVAKGLTGTWTAGSIRIVTLISETA